MKTIKDHNIKPYLKTHLSLIFAVIYALLGITWILITDKLAAKLSQSTNFLIQLSILKVWFFVIISSIVIYLVTNISMKNLTRSEKELRNQREELQIIFDSVPAMIWYKDTQNRILKVNKVVADVTGLSVADIVDNQTEDIYGEEAYKYYQDDLEVISTRNPKLGIIEPLTTSTGKKIWIRTDKIPYYDGNDNIIGVIVFSTEITEQVIAEEELLQKSKQQEALLNTIPAFVYFKDLKSKYIAINKAFADSLGMSVEEVIGKTDFDLFPQNQAETFVRDDKIVFSSRKPISNIIMEIIYGDSQPFWSTTTKSPYYNSSGQIEGIIGITMDIAEQKDAEEDLKKTLQENKELINEVVEYDKLKTAFFANMSHEFKTPLNVILSTLQLIASHQIQCRATSCTCKMIRYTSIMKQNCYRLLRLINNLMDTTKIDSGIISVNLTNCNIVSLVEETTMSVAEYIENHSIKLEFDTDIEEKIIACDVDKIERIMLNLLSNAVKFTKPGGNIWVTIKDELESIIISVKDNGIGIPEDKLYTIFERFSQVNVSLTRDHEGSGIGLFLVKSLIGMHNGSIRVISELGKGSEFIVDLPVRVLGEGKIAENEIFLLQNGKNELANIEFADIFRI